MDARLRLTVAVVATRDAARLTRALRALAPWPEGVELWVAHDGGADACQRALADVAPTAHRQLHDVAGLARAAVDNLAASTARGAWTLFWRDTLLAAPGLLLRLLQAAAAAEDVSRGRVVATPAPLFGATYRRLAGEPSPLTHFVAAQDARRTANWQNGCEIAADQVGADAWAASHACLQAYGPFDEALPAGLHVADFARRAYAAGCALRACDALQARRVGELDVQRAVAHWRALGAATASLMRKHQDPHYAVRLWQRLGPHRDMLTNAASLAAQLDAVERRLVGLRRPHPVHVEGLQTSLASLYGVSVLEGALQLAEVRALWPEAQPIKPAADASAPPQPPPQPPSRRRHDAGRLPSRLQARELPRA